MGIHSLVWVCFYCQFQNYHLWNIPLKFVLLMVEDFILYAIFLLTLTNLNPQFQQLHSLVQAEETKSYLFACLNYLGLSLMSILHNLTQEINLKPLFPFCVPFHRVILFRLWSVQALNQLKHHYFLLWCLI